MVCADDTAYALSQMNTLVVGQQLALPGYQLNLQNDGNLVLYCQAVGSVGFNMVLWYSRTDGRGSGGKLTLRQDGTLLWLGPDGTTWWTAGGPGLGIAAYTLMLQYDGNLVLCMCTIAHSSSLHSHCTFYFVHFILWTHMRCVCAAR